MRLQTEIERNGYFWKPDNERVKSPGRLKISDGGVIKIEILGDSLSDESLSGAFLHERNIDRIVGSIEKEGFATFEKCFYTKQSISSGGIATATIQANWAILGVAFDHKETILFDEISASVGGLDQWIGLSGLLTHLGSLNDSFSIGYERPSEQNLYECNEYSVTVYISPTISRKSRNEVTVIENARLSISTKEPHDLSYFLIIINRLADFLSFSADRTVTISNVIATNRSIISNLNDPQSHPEQMRLFYGAKNYDTKNNEQDIQDFLFTYSDIKSDVYSVVGSWLSLYDTIGPVMGLYFSAKAGAQKHTDGKFLSLVQALETFHRRTSSDTVMPSDDFQEIVQNLMNACPEEKQDWLNSRLTYGNELALRKRISIIISEFRKQFGNSRSRTSLSCKISDTRNYLTHYDKRLENKAAKGLELWNLCQKIEAIIQLCLLKKLGFTDKKIDIICDNNRYLSRKLGE